MPKNDKSDMKMITVVGGGAAGLAAAISAARITGGAQVRIIEKNDKVGRKLLATGNGRCNFTNKLCTYQDFVQSSGRESGVPCTDKSFVSKALSLFGIRETLQFFEEIGVMPREEDEGRMYPYSEQAAAVQEALKAETEALGVEIIYEKSVRSVRYNSDHRFVLELDDGQLLSTHNVILASGGKAGIQYGSAGEGYQMARAFDHTINKPIPALVPLLSDDPLLKSLKGVRVKGKVTLINDNKKAESKPEEGEIQFTGEGISGICVFNLSRYLRLEEPEDRYQDFVIRVDLLPEFTLEALTGQLTQRRKNLKNRKKEDFLNGMIQSKLALAVYCKSEIDLSGKVENLTDGQVQKISDTLKGWDIVLSGTKGWKEAQVTSGGVEPSEIDQNTMESKLVKGLYFAGELIDVDSKCGGYNLQWAWTSGTIAGKAAAGQEKR